MGFMKSRINNFTKTTYSLTDKKVFELLGINRTEVGDRVGEITYFKCLKVLSDDLSKLPLQIFKSTNNGKAKVKNYLNYILKTQPNPYMSASTFWSTVEFNRNQYGNAFVLAEREKGKIKYLEILPSESVNIVIDDKGIFKNENAIWYKFIDDKGKTHVFNKDEVLHFKNWITVEGKGLWGISTANILKNYIDRGLYANEFITKLVKNGMISDKLVIQYTSNLDEKAEKALISHMETFSANGSGKYLTMPLGLNIQNLSSKLVDSQFLELNKYNATQIASAFGISLQQINNFDKGNFANASVQQEIFYKETLLPILTQYEQELKIKLLTNKEKNNDYYFRFNVDAILRSAFKERVNSYAVAINNGVLTPNEARELENRPSMEGGDNLLGNGNYMPLKMAGIQWQGGDK